MKDDVGDWRDLLRFCNFALPRLRGGRDPVAVELLN